MTIPHSRSSISQGFHSFSVLSTIPMVRVLFYLKYMRFWVDLSDSIFCFLTLWLGNTMNRIRWRVFLPFLKLQDQSLFCGLKNTTSSNCKELLREKRWLVVGLSNRQFQEVLGLRELKRIENKEGEVKVFDVGVTCWIIRLNCVTWGTRKTDVWDGRCNFSERRKKMSRLLESEVRFQIYSKGSSSFGQNLQDRFIYINISFWTVNEVKENKTQ